MSKHKSSNKVADEIFDMLENVITRFFVFNSKIYWTAIQGMNLQAAGGLVIMAFLFMFPVTWFDYHLQLLQWINPKWFHYDLLVKLWAYGFFKNLLTLMGLFILGMLWVLGFLRMAMLNRNQNALDTVSLKNGRGDKAKVVDARWTEDKKFKIVKVWSFGIGAKQYDKAKDDLAIAFGLPVYEIRRLKKVGYIEIVFGEKSFPENVPFEQWEGELYRDGEFLIGESEEGITKGRIEHFPHMLIAGTTGGGKSVFFKQALAGLLTSSNHLQMYLIDLKGGLEFRSFATLPNVRVVKTIEDAVAMLEAVKSEMDARFAYLESSGREKIVPGHDPFDRIVVGIDEASVLYSKASKDSQDYEWVVKARNLTENIAKLSRAASIHLVLATQKVSKETIDTRIQENISGRMCFKLNTLEGSLRVLGNGRACDLPSIPGRGIWQFGSEMVEVQAPHIGTEELRQKLTRIAGRYQNGELSLHQGMLETDSPKLTAEKKEEVTLEEY